MSLRFLILSFFIQLSFKTREHLPVSCFCHPFPETKKNMNTFETSFTQLRKSRTTHLIYFLLLLPLFFLALPVFFLFLSTPCIKGFFVPVFFLPLFLENVFRLIMGKHPLKAVSEMKLNLFSFRFFFFRLLNSHRMFSPSIFDHLLGGFAPKQNQVM